MKPVRPLIAASTLLALGMAQAQFVTGGGSPAPRPATPAQSTPAQGNATPSPAAPAAAPAPMPAVPAPGLPAPPSGPATSPTPGSQPVVSVTPAPATAPAPAPKVAAPAVPAEPPAPVVEGPGIVRGNDRVIAPARPAEPIPGTAAGLRFEDAPLGDVVHVVMRQMAKVNYVIHPPISGAVTLSAAGNLSADDAVFLLENALLANGFVMAQDARGTYHIGRPEVVRNIVPAVRQITRNTPMPPGHGAVIIALRHIGAQEMAAILRPVAGEGIVRIDALRNLLVMQGNRSQAEGWLEMVNTFDVDILQGMTLAVLPLKHITTREIDQALRLLSGSAAGAAARAGTPAQTPAPTGTAPAPASAPGAAASSGAIEAAAAAVLGGARVIPMDRLNSLIVVAPRAGLIDEIKRWLDKIDQPGNSPSEPQLFVYPVQNGSAAHLANVLNGLFGGTGSSQQQANTGVAPAMGQAQGQTAGGFVNAMIGSGTGGGVGGGGGTALNPNAGRSTIQGAGITTATFQSGLRVMADGINNAILIYGTAAEYAKVEATLKRLDVPPSQVLIEASIIEVTLNDDLQYGLQWAFSEQKEGGTGTGVLSRAAGAVLGATPAGFSYTLTGANGNVRAVLNALAEKSLVKVISSPTLMVMDNHTASIAVGTQQPVQAGQTITTGGNVSNSIQYKDTGVNLTVTPSVNSGNMVAMTLNQSVTDVGTIDSATGQRAFLQRQIGSRVAVRSGETIVLGGLIRDNSTVGRSGIPFLSDLPLIGNVFGTSTRAGARTELLVMITPQVVRADNEIRSLATEMRDRMRAVRNDRESFFPNAPIDWTPRIPGGAGSLENRR
jgi:general secretion pathway protein D